MINFTTGRQELQIIMQKELESDILSLESIKNFLRLSTEPNPEVDKTLKNIRDFVISKAELASGLCIVPREIEARIFNHNSYIVCIGKANITKITRLALDGNQTEPSKIKIDMAKGKIYDVLASNIDIVFECGPSSASLLPSDLTFAMLTHAAFLWEQDGFENHTPPAVQKSYNFYAASKRDIKF